MANKYLPSDYLSSVKVEIRFSTDVEYGINEHNYGTKPKIIWVHSNYKVKYHISATIRNRMIDD